MAAGAAEGGAAAKQNKKEEEEDDDEEEDKEEGEDSDGAGEGAVVEKKRQRRNGGFPKPSQVLKGLDEIHHNWSAAWRATFFCNFDQEYIPITEDQNALVTDTNVGLYKEWTCKECEKALNNTRLTDLQNQVRSLL